MRRDNIPYVPNPPVNYYPAVPLEDMTLEEIKKKYIRTCAVANGNLSACSKCPSPCREGKRAIQLMANEIYNNPPVPLYGGKTLIEKAKEENMKRRQAELNEKKTEPVAKKKTSNGRIYVDGWYEKAVASGDAVQWIIDTFQISKTKAKAKIYGWQNRHPETKKEEKPVVEIKTEPKEETVVKEEAVEEKKELVVTDVSIEAKLELLMKAQEKHKNAMDEYMKLYNAEKAEYDKLKNKIDTLCNAMDIMNE